MLREALKPLSKEAAWIGLPPLLFVKDFALRKGNGLRGFGRVWRLWGLGLCFFLFCAGQMDVGLLRGGPQHDAHAEPAGVACAAMTNLSVQKPVTPVS